ncbi:MAG: IS1595 family transposase [Rhodospirillaceae bacterium]|nr:IS1595 family transposase [Rhodospirillaceae bacterium]
MPKTKRKTLTRRGSVGKAIVAGVKDRETNGVTASPVAATDSPALQGFVQEHTELGAKVYTDDASAYRDMPGFDHESVNHNAGEYVRNMAHANGIESFWAMLKRDYQGTCHHFSVKHLPLYVNEFAGRRNVRDADTIDQMASVVTGLVGKRLMYRDLVA